MPRSSSRSIGDFSRSLGLTPRTLRYWEELRLLPPAQRSAGGFRRYSEEHLRAARGVLTLKQAGLRLDEIRDLQTASQDDARLDRLVGDRIRELERQVTRLRRAVRELDTLRHERPRNATPGSSNTHSDLRVTLLGVPTRDRP